MKTFIVTVHTTDHPEQGDLVTVVTPSGLIEVRGPYALDKSAPFDHTEVEELIVKMFPGRRNKMHGAHWVGGTSIGGLVTIWQVDTDD